MKCKHIGTANKAAALVAVSAAVLTIGQLMHLLKNVTVNFFDNCFSCFVFVFFFKQKHKMKIEKK